jgi:hypothetical protein
MENVFPLLPQRVPQPDFYPQIYPDCNLNVVLKAVSGCGQWALPPDLDIKWFF